MSGAALEENDAAENALAEKRNADSAMLIAEVPMSDAQRKNKVEITVEVVNEKHEETNNSQEEGANKAITVDNDGENTTSEMHGDDMVDLYQNASEDDEEDDLWEDDGDDDDSEEDDEETAIDEDGVSEEEGTEVEDDEENSAGDDEEMAMDKDEVSEQEAIKENGDEENAGAEKEIAKGDEGVSQDHSAEKVEVNLKKVKTSKERKGKNHVTEESSKKLESIEKPISKRKGKKRVESMGMIFMCSSKTKNDCFRYKVLGLPESKKNIVEKIYPGMRLFLYDVHLRLMYGIYKADGRGGYNIEPKAFKSKFPSQVRFIVHADCLPLAEEKFKKVIKENYFTNNKFDCKLNSEQVKKLCKLFQYTNKGNATPKKLPRSRKAEKQPLLIRGEGSRKRRGDDRRRPFLKENIRYVERPVLKGKIRYIERPRKRPRNAISPEPLSRQPRVAPLPSSVPLIVLERNLDADPYRRDAYVESRNRDRDPYHRDSYESKLDRPTERHDPYRIERDPYLEHRDPYPNEREPYLAPRDRAPYRDERDPYLERRVSYPDARDSYPARSILYRDPDPYLDIRDGRSGPYRDNRDPYTQRRVYKEAPVSESYGSYRRDPVSVRRDVYGGDRGVAYRDSYRVEEVLDRPLSLERSRYDVVARDPYVSYQALPSTAEPLYSAAYPSRSGLTREYRL